MGNAFDWCYAFKIASVIYRVTVLKSLEFQGTFVIWKRELTTWKIFSIKEEKTKCVLTKVS